MDGCGGREYLVIIKTKVNSKAREKKCRLCGCGGFFLEKGKMRLRKSQWSSRLERACGCRIASKVFISERCSGRTDASV